MKESDQIMRRYLFGELSESEQSALEKEYFTDSQFFDQMLKTENELVDEYVRGRLSKEDRKRFEQSYMAHPERRERVKFAAALVNKLDQIGEAEQVPRGLSTWQKLLLAIRGKRPTLRLSLAFATLLVVLGCVWVVVERQRKHERELAQAAQEAERREREAQQIAKERRPVDNGQEGTDRGPQATPLPTPSPARSPETSVSLALTVGGVRGGDSGRTPTLVIPQGTTQARLLLSLKDNDYPSYYVSLQTVAGAEVFTQRNVKPRGAKTGASFAFTVPARTLESGDYILTLRGVGPDGKVDDLSKSLFRVEKR